MTNATREALVEIYGTLLRAGWDTLDEEVEGETAAEPTRDEAKIAIGDASMMADLSSSDENSLYCRAIIDVLREHEPTGLSLWDLSIRIQAKLAEHDVTFSKAIYHKELLSLMACRIIRSSSSDVKIKLNNARRKVI